jgi:hypothetical protein
MTPEFAKKLFEESDKKFDITCAYIWEGSPARHRINKIEEGKIIYDIAGSSSVEHSGDEDGIESQVHDLKKQQAEIIIDDKNYSVSCTEASCSISRSNDGDDGDGDYSVVARGTVTLKYILK